MAISEIEYRLFRALREKGGVIPLDGDVLLSGDASWKGDVGIGDLAGDIYRFAPKATRRDLFIALDRVWRDQGPDSPAQIAQIYWQTFFEPATLTSLAPDAPVTAEPGRRFDVVLSFGGRQAPSPAAIHDLAKPDGLMIHAAPFHGPGASPRGLLWDLAKANGYEVLTMICASLDPFEMTRFLSPADEIAARQDGAVKPSAQLHVVLRRGADDGPFRAP